ncbi:MAG: hypothetical protein EHM36_02455 [Deltaproteobacteria bacterium]|nr:MAG: hypothetical protein EHM36_02455 [Deltaproteobacteria bacterium]
MESKDLIKAGRLSEARKQLTEEVRTSPADSGKRTLLFQVLSFAGEWDKAERHLDTLIQQDSKKETGAQIYKNLIRGEKERLEVLKFQRQPSLMPRSPAYLNQHLTAMKELHDGKFEEATRLLNQIEEQLPPISGTINGKPFEGFRDTDVFLSYFFEVIVHERYAWVPFEGIQELTISPPTKLFDLLWIPAQMTTWENLRLYCFLPVLYPESFLHKEDQVKLGRMTDWIPMGGAYSKGMGQHVFEAGDEEVTLLEIREAVFKKSDSGEKDASSD